MIELILYSAKYEADTIRRIADFFGYHNSLLQGEMNLTDESYRIAKCTLEEWTEDDSHELYMVQFESIVVGFLHIGYRGSNVAWIEDIYIDKEHRSKGIASSSIHQAEEIIRANPQYTAVCLEVVPRNENALRLYHKLGYDSISIITV